MSYTSKRDRKFLFFAAIASALVLGIMAPISGLVQAQTTTSSTSTSEESSNVSPYERQTKYSDLPEATPASVADQLELVNQITDAQLKQHAGWTSIISSTPENVTILYLGPGEGNPYQYTPKVNTSQVRDQTTMQSSASATQTASPTQTVSESISPHDYGAGHLLSAYHIQMSLIAKKSSNTHVDYLVNHNEWTGNSARWLQDGFMYDIAGLAHPNQWLANWDVHCSQCSGSQPGYPAATQMPGTVTVGNTIYEDIYAIGGGVYKMWVTNSNTGSSLVNSYSTGGRDNILHLLVNSGILVQDSGTQAEDLANDGTSKYHWGTSAFNFKFWATSTTVNPITTCNSFYAPEPPNGPNNPVTTTTVTGTACRDTMSYP